MSKGLFDSVFTSISDRIAEYKTQMLQEFVPIYVKSRHSNADFDLTGELVKVITKGKARNYDAFSSAAKAIIDEKESFSISSLDVSALCTILIGDNNPFTIANNELRFCVKRLKKTRNFTSHKSYQEPEELMFQTLVGELYDIEEFLDCLYRFDEKKGTSNYTCFVDSNRTNLEIIRKDLFADFITIQKYKFDIDYIKNLPNPFDAYSEFHHRYEQYCRDPNGRRDANAGYDFLRACEISELEPSYEYLASHYEIIKKDHLKAQLYRERGKEFSSLLGRTSDYHRQLKFDSISDDEALSALKDEFPEYNFRIEKVGREKKVYCYKKNM